MPCMVILVHVNVCVLRLVREKKSLNSTGLEGRITDHRDTRLGEMSREQRMEASFD